jgi:hypothetical protein
VLSFPSTAQFSLFVTPHDKDPAWSLVLSWPSSDLTPPSFLLLLQFAFADFSLVVFNPPWQCFLY